MTDTNRAQRLEARAARQQYQRDFERFIAPLLAAVAEVQATIPPWSPEAQACFAGTFMPLSMLLAAFRRFGSPEGAGFPQTMHERPGREGWASGDSATAALHRQREQLAAVVEAFPAWQRREVAHVVMPGQESTFVGCYVDTPPLSFGGLAPIANPPDTPIDEWTAGVDALLAQCAAEQQVWEVAE